MNDVLKDFWRGNSSISVSQSSAAVGLQSTLRRCHACSDHARTHRGNGM